QGQRVGAVVPRFYDRRENVVTKFPLYREEKGVIQALPQADGQSSLLQVVLLIRSSMLVNTRAWAHVKYDARLIVDHTDSDWCFRARAAGYQLFASLEAEMGHELSEAPPTRRFGISILQYSSLRRYYYFRNTAY